MSEKIQYSLLSPDTVGDGDLLKGLNKEDANLRIQALLTDWLRMENVVVLTGAGSSVGSGGRLMAGDKETNLEHLVIDAVKHCKLSQEAESVINWRIENGYCNGTFEEWLSCLFNVNNLLKMKNTPINSITWKKVTTNSKKDEIILSATAEDELKKFIERAIFCECGLELDSKILTGEKNFEPQIIETKVQNSETENKSEESDSGHIPFLAKLVSRDANLGRTHLFTLNYDTLFEQAMEELSIQYFDGFSGKSSARFDPSVYGLDIYFPGDVTEGKIRRFDKFIQFYKLHGSIHWYFDNNACKAHHRNLSFTKDYRECDSIKKAKLLNSSDCENIQSFGILPTSQKFTQTIDMPFAHLFRLFHERLYQPQTFLIVLGYGFGDDHVNRIIESALTNPSLIVLVVEPNPDSAIVKRLRKYQKLGQRLFVLTENIEVSSGCSYKIATFSDFANNVMPDVKWLEDFRRLRSFERQIRITEYPPKDDNLENNLEK